MEWELWPSEWLRGGSCWVFFPRLTVLVLVGSVVAFWFLGTPPDQVGVATKLVEMFGLALLVVPGHGVKRTFAPAGVVSLVVVTGIAVWIGAFASAGEDGGHHGGEYPEPGTVVPYIDRLEATLAEQQAADDLFDQVVLGVAKYDDPAVAEGDGYNVGTIVGRDHHADNPAYLEDGRILDPERPETLVYASTESGAGAGRRDVSDAWSGQSRPAGRWSSDGVAQP